MDEFKLNKYASYNVWLRELLLCILTSNSSFINAYRALNYIYSLGLPKDENKIMMALRSVGYRFYRLKARYIVYALNTFDSKMAEQLRLLADRDQFEAREFLMDNLYGLGMKESSHYLRNLGYFDLSIIDRHVIDFLRTYLELNITNKLTKKRYLEYEGVLRSISTFLGIPPGIFDLYIWYVETGTLVK